MSKLSLVFIIVKKFKIVKNCRNCQKLSKIVKDCNFFFFNIVKVFTLWKNGKNYKRFQNCQKESKCSKTNCQTFCQGMFPHQSDQVSQRSQVSRVPLCMSKVKVPWVTDWLSQWQGHPLSCSWQLKTIDQSIVLKNWAQTHQNNQFHHNQQNQCIHQIHHNHPNQFIHQNPQFHQNQNHQNCQINQNHWIHQIP